MKLTPHLLPPDSTFTACQGLHLLAPTAARAGHRLLSCTAVRLACNPARACAGLSLLLFPQAGAFRIHDSTGEDDSCSWQEHAAWSCAAGVTTFAASSDGGHCCVGWAGKEIAIYDVATHQAVHVAKPPPKDWLGMYVRIVCASAAFVPGATVAGSQVLVGGDHAVRLFDFRAQRRAVRLMALGDKGVVTAVAAHTDGATAAAGNARGQMLQFDLGTGKCLGAFKGCTGAVKAMAMHPSLPLVVATGLDRHMRVYSTTNRSLLAAVYVKQACTGVAFCPHGGGDGGWASRALPPPPPLPLPADAGEEGHRDALGGGDDTGGKARKRKDKRTTAMIETMSRGAARMLAGDAQPPARRVKKLKAAKPQDMQLGITYDDE